VIMPFALFFVKQVRRRVMHIKNLIR
jgi:hypothetical protein